MKQMDNEKKPVGGQSPEEAAAEDTAARTEEAQAEDTAAAENTNTSGDQAEAADQPEGSGEAPEQEAEAEAPQDGPKISPEVEAAAKQEAAEEEMKKKAQANAPKASRKNIFASSKFKHGGMATAFTAGFIVIVILINVVVSILGERFPSLNIDLTAQSVNTLSEDSIEVVDSVSRPTTITILAPEDSIEQLSYAGMSYSQVANIAERMAERNSNITVQYVDIDANPAFASQYPDDQLATGSVIVETDLRHRVLSISDLFSVSSNYQTGESAYYSQVDGALASAVNQANSEELPVIAFATGHGEMMETSSLEQLLSTNNFEPVTFNMLTDEIPEDTQVIVIGAPSTDYTVEEIAKLDAFLNDETKEMNRTLFITFYPAQEELPNLSTFLAEWGMEVSRDVIGENDSSRSLGDYISIFSNLNTDEVVFNDESTDYGYVITPYSVPINVLFDGRADVSTYVLAQTSDQAFLIGPNETSIDEARSHTGTYNTIVMGQKYFNNVNGSSNLYRANVIVSGSMPMFTSTFLNSSAYGNQQYTLDMMRYATGTTDSNMGVYVQPVQMNAQDITLTGYSVVWLGLGVFTFLPFIVLMIAAIVVYVKRRHL